MAEWSRPLALVGAFVALLASAAAHLDAVNGEFYPQDPERALWAATSAAVAGCMRPVGMVLGVLLWYPHGHDWLGLTSERGLPAPASEAGQALVVLGAATASSALADGRWTGAVPLLTALATLALLGWRWTYLAPHQILPPLLLLASAAALRLNPPAQPAPVRPSQPS